MNKRQTDRLRFRFHPAKGKFRIVRGLIAYMLRHVLAVLGGPNLGDKQLSTGICVRADLWGKGECGARFEHHLTLSRRSCVNGGIYKTRVGGCRFQHHSVGVVA